MDTDGGSVNKEKVLILATETCAYPGADSVGQAHSSYPTNTDILRVRAPVLFPEQFYLDCFKKSTSTVLKKESAALSSCPVVKSARMKVPTRPWPKDWTASTR